jgi:ribosomal protein L7Ae-like RNA K-turn-binding protein
MFQTKMGFSIIFVKNTIKLGKPLLKKKTSSSYACIIKKIRLTAHT